MACELHLGGDRTMDLVRDRFGQRDYRLTSIVRGDPTKDGPTNALATPGLPQPGDAWSFKDDVDVNAICTLDATVKPLVPNEPNEFWIVEQIFTTKPFNLCLEEQLVSPLLMPQKVSGNFVKFQEEATVDRFGRQITNSAFEQIRGPQVEFDRNRLSVSIEQNVSDLELDLLSAMVDTVNHQPLWGFKKRCIKLSAAPWEAKYYGQCFKYYTRTLQFDTNYQTFDRTVVDEGTKVINGRWDQCGKWELVDVKAAACTDDPALTKPNHTNPAHFMKAIDRAGNPMHVILNGAGAPYDPSDRTDEKYWCLMGLSRVPVGNPPPAGAGGGGAGPPLFQGGLKINPGPGAPQPVAQCLHVRCEEAFLQLQERRGDTPRLSWELYGPYNTAAQCALMCSVTPPADLILFAATNLRVPANPCSTPGSIRIEKYDESNFLLLNIPLQF